MRKRPTPKIAAAAVLARPHRADATRGPPSLPSRTPTTAGRIVAAGDPRRQWLARRRRDPVRDSRSRARTRSSSLTALPDIVESVLIDGYSQPGSAWNSDPLGDNAVLQIELSGSGTDGLTITGGAAIVQGLALYGFQTAIASDDRRGQHHPGQLHRHRRRRQRDVRQQPRGAHHQSVRGRQGRRRLPGGAQPDLGQLDRSRRLGHGRQVDPRQPDRHRPDRHARASRTARESSSPAPRSRPSAARPRQRNVISGNFGDGVDLDATARSTPFATTPSGSTPRARRTSATAPTACGPPGSSRTT